MVDHHHLARALWQLGIRQVALGEKLADLSDLNIKSFWPEMEKKGYCWPIDADGDRRPYSTIPHHIKDLTDNVWRTLARELRGEAFDDLDTPFQEFIALRPLAKLGKARPRRAGRGEQPKLIRALPPRTRNKGREMRAERIVIMPTTVWWWRENL